MYDALYKLFRVFFPHQHPALVKRKYGIPETVSLNVRLTSDGWFIVTSPELPGLVTQAKNHKELIEMVNDAILCYFDVPKKEADIVYDNFNIVNQVIQYSGQLVTKVA